VEILDGNLRQHGARPGNRRRLLGDVRASLVVVYSGANFGYRDILEDGLWRIEMAASLATSVGAANLIVGGGAKRAQGTTDEDFERLAEGLDRAADTAEHHGLRASYHSHLSTIVEGPIEVDRILSTSRIGFCPDTAHLAAGGGDHST
jgi:inosose dehydratase